jgi:hypothetical protein
MAYEIRPMSIGEILDTGFRLLRNHFGLLMGLAAIVYVPMGLLSQLMIGIAGGDPEQMQMEVVIPILVTALVLLVVVSIGYPLVSTAITMALSDVYVGKSTGIGSALGQTWAILLPVVGTSLLIGLFVMLGLIALVIPGIWLAFSYMVSAPVMVVERRFGMEALRRSRDLMRGNKGRGFVLGVVVGVLQMVVSTGATWALSAWPLANGIASTLVGMVIIGFLTAINVVFYFDVRCRKEAFDLEHLAQLVEQRGAPATAPAL